VLSHFGSGEAVRDELRDLRNMLGRMGWNATAAAEQATIPTAPAPAPVAPRFAAGTSGDEVAAIYGDDVAAIYADGLEAARAFLLQQKQGAAAAPANPADAPEGIASEPLPDGTASAAGTGAQPAGEVAPESARHADAPQRRPAPAETPKPPRSPYEGVKWTQERKELFRREYRAGTATPAIIELLNALPGPKITSVSGISGWMKVYREQAPAVVPQAEPGAPTPVPEPAVAAAPDAPAAPVSDPPVPVSVPQPPPVAAAPEPASPAPPAQPPTGATLLVTALQAESWAFQRGIPWYGNGSLGRVNDKRRELGLPPFELKTLVRAA
jgi:hypothetical protein